MDVILENNKSVVAEQYLIGAVLLGGSTAYDEVADRIDELCFVLPEHQQIWKAINGVGAAGNDFDVVSIAELLGDMEVNGTAALAYLFSLANAVPSAANVEIYSNVIAGRSSLARMQKAVGQAQHLLEQPGGDALEKIARVQDMVFAVSTASNQSSLHDSQSFIGEALKIIAERSSGDTTGITGLTTTIDGLDELTSGMHAGQLIIIAGRPSMGKTALAVNMALTNAVKHAKTCVVFSLEMVASELGQRMLSMESEVDGKRLKTGRLIAGDWDRIKTAGMQIGAAKIFIEDGTPLTVPQIRTKCRKVQQQYGLDLIVIDYLQLLSGASNRRNDNRTVEIGEMTRSLKLLAKELGIPIILLSQLSRDIEKRPNKRPLMSDLRESGSIEQDADVIIFVYRDEVYNPDTPDRGIAELIVGKQRGGAIGDVRTGFIGGLTKFVNKLPSGGD